LGLLYLQFRHTISNTVSAVLCFVMPALFFSALFGMAAVENRTLKKFVRDAGLTCRQCGKALIRGTSNIPSYEQTLSCPYCGTSLIRSASA
jgi:DNA-directed RNA polymerase subunit RPC12/RpoP